MSVPPEALQDVGIQETVYPAPPQNKGTVPFHVLSLLFDRLSTERKHDKRRKLLEGWFHVRPIIDFPSSVSRDGINQHWRDQCGYDLYPVLRLILPQKDRERTMYGLKEKTLAKAYIKLIPLGMKDTDAIRLLNWKKPTEKEVSSRHFELKTCFIDDRKRPETSRLSSMKSSRSVPPSWKAP
jgi:DNA ligase 4